MIALKTTALEGCYELQPRVLVDERESFNKTFHSDWFAEHGLRADFVEQYYSVSNKRVLRGLHFQTPPHDHAKLVYCTSGRVLDGVVDLRRNSATFGKCICMELSAELGNMLYLESGLAHGFHVLSETATVIYNVTSVYAPDHDKGVRWDSVAIPWPDQAPILSDRDAKFPGFTEFASPF